MNTKIVNFQLSQIMRACSQLLGAAIVLFLLFRTATPSFAQSVVVNPGSVADFDQVNFGDQGSANFGSMGELTIDVTNSLSLLGSSSGYVNVVDGSGNWLVQNMPVLPYSVTGSDSLGMPYDITGDSDGTQASSENLRVVLSATPQFSAPAGTTSSFTVSQAGEDAGGVSPQIPQTALAMTRTFTRTPARREWCRSHPMAFLASRMKRAIKMSKRPKTNVLRPPSPMI